MVDISFRAGFLMLCNLTISCVSSGFSLFVRGIYHNTLVVNLIFQ